MNAMNDVAEARATALSLRASARACTREQGALKFRLTRAAESLDAMVLLAVRGFDRIEQLEATCASDRWRRGRGTARDRCKHRGPRGKRGK